MRKPKNLLADLMLLIMTPYLERQDLRIGFLDIKINSYLRHLASDSQESFTLCVSRIVE